jgi:hypothetical protein
MLWLKLWRLDVYAVMRRVYVANLDTFQRPCLRVAWHGNPVLVLGPKPGL